MMQVSVRKYLSICLIYLITLCTPLFACNRDELSTLVSEMIASLNYGCEGSAKTNELGIKIYDLLNERYSKNDGVNIMMNSKELEEFYRQKNDELWLNKYFFIAQMVLATGMAIGLCYLIYQLGNIFNWPGFSSSKNAEGIIKKRVSGTSLHHENSNASQSNLEDFARNGLQDQQNFNIDSSAQVQPRSGQAWTVIRGKHLLDVRLQDAVELQIERARNIGFKFSEIQVHESNNSVNRTSGDNQSLLQLIIKQIEYAQGIGVDLTGVQ